VGLYVECVVLSEAVETVGPIIRSENITTTHNNDRRKFLAAAEARPTVSPPPSSSRPPSPRHPHYCDTSVYAAQPRTRRHLSHWPLQTTDITAKVSHMFRYYYLTNICFSFLFRTFQLEWKQLSTRISTSGRRYDTNVQKWTCNCGQQKYSANLLCKHLVQAVPPPSDNFFAEIYIRRTTPFYRHPELRPHGALSYDHDYEDGSISDGDDHIWSGNKDILRDRSKWAPLLKRKRDPNEADESANALNHMAKRTVLGLSSIINISQSAPNGLTGTSTNDTQLYNEENDEEDVEVRYL
jgi:hypothetical protein